MLQRVELLLRQLMGQLLQRRLPGRSSWRGSCRSSWLWGVQQSGWAQAMGLQLGSILCCICQAANEHGLCAIQQAAVQQTSHAFALVHSILQPV